MCKCQCENCPLKVAKKLNCQNTPISSADLIRLSKEKQLVTRPRKGGTWSDENCRPHRIRKMRYSDYDKK